MYRRDAGGLNYKLETVSFHPPHVLEDGRLATFWGADFNLMIPDLGADGAGKVAYAWQAGHMDGFTRNSAVEDLSFEAQNGSDHARHMTLCYLCRRENDPFLPLPVC